MKFELNANKKHQLRSHYHVIFFQHDIILLRKTVKVKQRIKKIVKTINFEKSQVKNPGDTCVKTGLTTGSRFFVGIRLSLSTRTAKGSFNGEPVYKRPRQKNQPWTPGPAVPLKTNHKEG
jgi:hypothetical protein